MAELAESFSSRSRRRWASARRISYCLFSATKRLHGRFGGREFGGGLVGEPGQTLHFRGGLGHFRLGLGDRGVQFAVVEFRDDVALLDELRLGHVQLGEPSGEFGGQHRLPVGHDIAGGGEFGAAVRGSPAAAEILAAGATPTSATCQPRISRGARTAAARRATSTTHTQGDIRRRRRERSIFNAAKPSEDIIPLHPCKSPHPAERQ